MNLYKNKLTTMQFQIVNDGLAQLVMVKKIRSFISNVFHSNLPNQRPTLDESKPVQSMQGIECFGSIFDRTQLLKDLQ